MSSARVLPPTPESLEIAANAIRSGGVGAIPTETVYGLAGRLFDESALLSIFKAKERPLFDPLIAHVSDRDFNQLKDMGLIDWGLLTDHEKEIAGDLARLFWPGPLTLLLPRGPKVPDLATSGLPNVAVRCPNHPLTLALLNKLGEPLAAPSANRFGRISPTRPEDVLEELGDRISWILDGGHCTVGVESTIVTFPRLIGVTTSQGTDPTDLIVLRHGGIPIEELRNKMRNRARVTELSKATAASHSEQTAELAPGRLLSHYAPGKPLHLLDRSSLASFAAKPENFGRKLGLLSFDTPHDPSGFYQIQELDTRDEGERAARGLFHALRILDASDCEILIAEKPPRTEGLWRAIADRLERAQLKRPT